jgi:hypothetical protein
MSGAGKMTPAGVENKSEAEMESLPHGGSSGEKANPHETALLEALREFVRHLNDPQPPRAKAVRPFTWGVLFVFVIDAAFLYSEFERWFETLNPILEGTLKVLPWLLGVTAFTASSERARQWILEQCQRVWLAVLAVVLLLPLLTLRQPLFSVLVLANSDADKLTYDTSAGNLEVRGPVDKVFQVRFRKGLEAGKEYRIALEDPRLIEASQLHSVPATLVLTLGRVLRATMAQIPWAGRLFGPAQISLTPLYPVLTHSSSTEAKTHIQIEGQFQEGFLTRESLEERNCSPATPSNRKVSAVSCEVPAGDGAVSLPMGKYTVMLFRDSCHVTQTVDVREDNSELLNFDKVCDR